MGACSRPAHAVSLQGRYQEAARMFSKHGQVERAMEMFTDLRQFAEAKAWAEAWARSNSGAAAFLCAAKQELLQARATPGGGPVQEGSCTYICCCTKVLLKAW